MTPPKQLREATLQFLAKIPVFPEFRNTADISKYAPVPKDWYLFVSDIKGSTKATEEGRYKEVNVVGASAVMAVLNAIKPYEVFYVFGGDGATFLCPPELVELVGEALLASKQLAKEQFGFDLRVGRVPVWHLYVNDYEVKLARFRVSEHITQSALSGDGLVTAETWVKNPPPGEHYELTTSAQLTADTTGLECRWNPVESKKGKMTSILVQSLNLDPKLAEIDYQDVLNLVDQVMEKDENPVFGESDLSIAAFPQSYLAEAKARSAKATRLGRMWYLVKSYILTVLVGGILWNSLLKKWGNRYKKELVSNSDYRKFDGVLRMVLDLTPGQLKRIQGLLDKKSAADQVVYGIHTSNSALITCLIFERSKGNHLHFVDGNDGGYSAAAKDLKKKVAERQTRVCSFKPKKSAA